MAKVWLSLECPLPCNAVLGLGTYAPEAQCETDNTKKQSNGAEPCGNTNYCLRMIDAGSETAKPTVTCLDGKRYVGLCDYAEFSSIPGAYHQRRSGIGYGKARRLIVFFEEVGVDLERLAIHDLPVRRIRNFHNRAGGQMTILEPDPALVCVIV